MVRMPGDLPLIRKSPGYALTGAFHASFLSIVGVLQQLALVLPGAAGHIHGVGLSSIGVQLAVDYPSGGPGLDARNANPNSLAEPEPELPSRIACISHPIHSFLSPVTTWDRTSTMYHGEHLVYC